MTQAATATAETTGTGRSAVCEAWERRARELAEARQTPAPRLLAADCYRTVFGVPGPLGPMREYIVWVTPHDGRVVCDCLAGQHGRPCCHAGAVLQAEAKRLARLEAADDDRWALVEAGQW